MSCAARFALSPLVFVFGCSAGTSPGVFREEAPPAASAPADVPAAPAEPTNEPDIVAPAPGEPIPDAIVEQPAGVEERRILAAVAPKHLTDLYRLVGRYARGDAPIYEGTWSAEDNMGSLGANYEDGVMNDAPVDAALAWEEKMYWKGQSAAGWSLLVRSSTHRLTITQTASALGVTSFSIVVPNNVGGGLTGTCDACFPALSATSTSFAAADVVATGKWGNDKLLEVTASGTLTRVPLAKVTFERVTRVVDPISGAAIKDFKVVGSEMVRSIEDRYTEKTPVPAGTQYFECQRHTSYELDAFVDRSRLVRQGLRNMSITGTETCCTEDGPIGGCRKQTCF